MRRLLDVVVYGHPEPKGSTRSFRMGKGDNARIVTTSDNPDAAPWAKAIGKAIRPRSIATGAVFVRMRFVFSRPASHTLKSGRLALGAPVHPTRQHVGDTDKLARTVLDALTGVIYVDDAQVTDLYATKRYGGPADREGVRIEVYALEAEAIGMEEIEP